MSSRKKIAIFVVIFLVLAAFGSFVVQQEVAKRREQQEQERILQEQEAARLEAQKAEEERIAAEQAQLEELKNKLRAGNPTGEDLKVVFLTFDDGPDICSNEVLDILQANNVKATFFTNGNTSEGMDAVYRRIVNEGHTLANHTWSHDYDLYNNQEAFLADIDRLADYQRQVTGTEPSKIFRFPGGSTNTNQSNVDAVVAKGYGFFDWTASAGDGSNIALTPEQVVSKIRTEMQSNSVNVILTHAEKPAKDWSRAALDSLIKGLLAEGYTFMTLDPTYNIARFTEPSV